MEITPETQPEQAKSQEYQTFESIVKKAFATSKEELAERMAEEKKAKKQTVKTASK